MHISWQNHWGFKVFFFNICEEPSLDVFSFPLKSSRSTSVLCWICLELCGLQSQISAESLLCAIKRNWIFFLYNWLLHYVKLQAGLYLYMCHCWAKVNVWKLFATQKSSLTGQQFKPCPQRTCQECKLIITCHYRVYWNPFTDPLIHSGQQLKSCSCICSHYQLACWWPIQNHC